MIVNPAAIVKEESNYYGASPTVVYRNSFNNTYYLGNSHIQIYSLQQGLFISGYSVIRTTKLDRSTE